MVNLVGNPQNSFSRDAAQMIKDKIITSTEGVDKISKIKEIETLYDKTKILSFAFSVWASAHSDQSHCRALKG